MSKLQLLRHPCPCLLTPSLCGDGGCVAQCLGGPAHALRQSAAYGMGVLARVGGPSFTPVVASVVAMLLASAQHPVRPQPWLPVCAACTALQGSGLGICTPLRCLFVVLLFCVLAEFHVCSPLPHACWCVLPPSLQAAASDDAAQICADNSIAALVQFLEHRFDDMVAAGVDLNGLMTTILSSLPLCADTVEACNVHAWVVAALSPGGRLAGAMPSKTIAQLAQAILGGWRAALVHVSCSLLRAAKCAANGRGMVCACVGEGVCACSLCGLLLTVLMPAAHEESMEQQDEPLCNEATLAAFAAFIGVRVMQGHMTTPAVHLRSSPYPPPLE